MEAPNSYILRLNLSLLSNMERDLNIKFYANFYAKNFNSVNLC